MAIEFQFGEHSSVRLDIAPDRCIAVCRAPNTASIDVAAATKSAIESPLDFPPLRQAVVPGDHVVLALGPGVPQAADIVAAIVPTLLEAGVAPQDISLLRAPIDLESGQPDPRGRLAEPIRDTVQTITHDPAHQDELGYLAADPQGAPIYLNRHLCDADLVIPIGCLRSEATAAGSERSRVNGKANVWNDTLYPTFADRTTIEHLAPNGVPLTAGQLAHRHKQVDQIAWLLGIQATAQVVPAGGDRALQVLAGLPEAVFTKGGSISRSAWQYEVPARANLVIAAISGGKSQQTWANLAHALQSALNVVNEDGAIVLCTELETQPGPALRVLTDASDSETSQKRLRKLHSPDAPLARLLAQSLDRCTIYLLSRLPEETVSSLGLAYVASADEVARLATHHDSCILISDAQYAAPYVAEKQVGA
jgi:nickel-dependent lactate racemase